MAKAKSKSKRKMQVKNLRPKVKGVDGRNVKGGFSKINPGDGGSTGGGLGDKIK